MRMTIRLGMYNDEADERMTTTMMMEKENSLTVCVCRCAGRWMDKIELDFV